MGKRCQGRLSWLFTQDYLCCSVPVASRTGTLRPALQLPTPHVELGLHKGSQTALWVVQNWGFDLVQNCELGYLSRDVQISWLKHRLSGPSQCLCGIWFQSKLNKNNEITHVKIFHELGAALTREAADGVCEASSSPGLYLWDNHGTGQVHLECPLLRQPGLTGSSLALLFASLTCKVWCRGVWRRPCCLRPGAQHHGGLKGRRHHSLQAPMRKRSRVGAACC